MLAWDDVMKSYKIYILWIVVSGKRFGSVFGSSFFRFFERQHTTTHIHHVAVFQVVGTEAVTHHCHCFFYNIAQPASTSSAYLFFSLNHQCGRRASLRSFFFVLTRPHELFESPDLAISPAVLSCLWYHYHTTTTYHNDNWHSRL